MAQIVDEAKQAELVAAKISTTSGIYGAIITAFLNNNETIFIGSGTSQSTPLVAGGRIEVPANAIGKIYIKGTPTGWALTGVVTGSKQFLFAGDQTARILIGDTISIVGSTANDGFYTVAAVSFGGGTTTVTVNETIPDGTVDGTLYHADAVALFGKG